jgi:hypothetical protein
MAKTQFVKTEGLSTITISATNGNRCYVCYYNDLPNVGDEALTNVTQVATSLPQTITVDSSYTYVAIQVCYNPSGANVSNVQVESGSTATSYAPYSNICPIIGWDEVNVTIQDDIDNPTTTETITIQLGDTYYGGKLDVVSGVLTVDRANVLVSGCTWYGSNGTFYTDKAVSTIKKGDGRYDHCISDAFKTVNKATSGQLSDGEVSVDSSGYIQLKDLRYSTPSDFKTNMGSTQLVYELATPLTYQLTPTIIKSLQGENNFFADSGEVIKLQYWGKEQN